MKMKKKKKEKINKKKHIYTCTINQTYDNK